MQQAAQHSTPPASDAPSAKDTMKGIEKLIVWVGSPASLVIHTIVFAVFFAASLLRLVPWELMLLVLTTAVSLEAIYLAIFIQMSVNRQGASLREVEEDVESIQENVEELGENVEELGENVEELGENVEDLKEDVEDIQEDIGEDDEDVSRERKQAAMLDTLTNDVKAILATLESLKTK
jgi:peptidoglycan hydrolase CwlO-like protein